MKNLKVYFGNFKKRGLALATAATLAFTPVIGSAEGLGDLLAKYGVETQTELGDDFETIYGFKADEYTETTTLDLESWESGFASPEINPETKESIGCYHHFIKYCPSLADMNGANLAALYFFGNYSYTPEELIPELAAKGYVSENNCVDLGIIREDDPATAEDETMTEIIDQEGFINFINATQAVNKINDMAERHMRADWYGLHQNGGGHLNPANYPDPSKLIQDPRERQIVHTWYVKFVEGYDLTPGTFSNNENIQFVYRAIGQLTGDRNELSINDLSDGAQYIVRATLGNQLKVFTENYMYDNYLETFMSDDVHVYDTRELLDNESFVKYQDAQPLPERCVSELKELINDREALHRITTVDMTGNLFNTLQQVIVPYDEYMEIKSSAKTYKKTK